MTRQVREDKPTWSAVPEKVRRGVEELLGSRVLRAVRSYGGYGPSATFRLTLARGRRAFVKGTFPLPEGSGVIWVLRNEELVYRRLTGFIHPWAPRYLGSVHVEGWHFVALEDVDGEAMPPWTGSRALRAARSYAEFHSSTFAKRLPGWLSRTQHREFGTFWSAISGSPEGVAALARLGAARRGEAERWIRRALPELVRAERRLLRAREPFALLHFDTRSDNLRLQGDLLRIFDWPFASVGPPEFDLAAFAQSIASEGGPTPEQVVEWYAAVLPVRVSALVGSIAGIAGYFADRAPKPPLEGLPRLRSVQRRQLKASLRWAARVLDLPEPAWITAVRD